MKKVNMHESLPDGKPPSQPPPPPEHLLKDAGILDLDYFLKTNRVDPDLVGSILAHYAPKWAPELGEREYSGGISPGSATATWRKKKLLVEALIGILQQEKDATSLPCNFLLRLLRVANVAGVDPIYREEIEKSVSLKLGEASLKELMIPSFSHTCGTLLDVRLMTRLVKGFMGLDRTGGTLIKVARLVDSYLAEAAVDPNLSLEEFVQLAGALPPHARAMDDGLYRAIDTYFKAHQGMSKQERMILWRLIDTRKFSTEASMHASQNERLPVRAVIQVLFSEQSKLMGRQLDWSGPMGGFRSPSPGPSVVDLPGRCMSKREIKAQQVEVKRLKEEVVKLQDQINMLQIQMDGVVEKKKGFFRWKTFSFVSVGFKGLNESKRIWEA